MRVHLLLTLLFDGEKHNILRKRGHLTEEEVQSLSLGPLLPYLEPTQRSPSARREQARMQQLQTWSDPGPTR
ncbi:hypothetical protein PG989_000677 [Apiospora arundinis]